MYACETHIAEGKTTRENKLKIRLIPPLRFYDNALCTHEHRSRAPQEATSLREFRSACGNECSSMWLGDALGDRRGYVKTDTTVGLTMSCLVPAEGL